MTPVRERNFRRKIHVNRQQKRDHPDGDADITVVDRHILFGKKGEQGDLRGHHRRHRGNQADDLDIPVIMSPILGFHQTADRQSHFQKGDRRNRDGGKTRVHLVRIRKKQIGNDVSDINDAGDEEQDGNRKIPRVKIVLSFFDSDQALQFGQNQKQVENAQSEENEIRKQSGDDFTCGENHAAGQREDRRQHHPFFIGHFQQASDLFHTLYCIKRRKKIEVESNLKKNYCF